MCMLLFLHSSFFISLANAQIQIPLLLHCQTSRNAPWHSGRASVLLLLVSPCTLNSVASSWPIQTLSGRIGKFQIIIVLSNWRGRDETWLFIGVINAKQEFRNGVSGKCFTVSNISVNVDMHVLLLFHYIRRKVFLLLFYMHFAK